MKWLTTGNLDLRELVAILGRAAARFITITANRIPGRAGFLPRVPLGLEWPVPGISLSTFPAKPCPASYDICEAADWIEREIHEEFAIDFTGREYEPLLLREGRRPASICKRWHDELQAADGSLSSRRWKSLTSWR